MEGAGGMSAEIHIDPTNWVQQESRWDRIGPFYEGDPNFEKGNPTHTHVWGANVGAFVYHFVLPRGERAEFAVSARLSSEHPWSSSPPNHFTDATLIVNGRDYPSKRVIADNGSGQIYTWTVSPDDLREGSNRLSLGVKKNATYRNGLCVYHLALAPGEV